MLAMSRGTPTAGTIFRETSVFFCKWRNLFNSMTGDTLTTVTPYHLFLYCKIKKSMYSSSAVFIALAGEMPSFDAALRRFTVFRPGGFLIYFLSCATERTVAFVITRALLSVNCLPLPLLLLFCCLPPCFPLPFFPLPAP